MTTRFKLNPMADGMATGPATLDINNGYGHHAEFMLTHDEILALANMLQSYLLASLSAIRSPRRGGK